MLLRRSSRLMLLATLFACGGGGADMQEPGGSGDPSVLALTTPASTLGVGGSIQLNAVPKDESGNTVAGLPAPTFTSSDPGKASVDASGIVTGTAPGTVTITATLSVNGRTLTATAQLTVTPPPPGGGNLVTTTGATFSPSSVTIAQGDSVRWVFAGATHNVTFLGIPPVGGDIPDQAPGSSVTRTFTAAGTYDYECTRHSGMNGTVSVQSGTIQTFTSVSISPATPSIAIGGTVQLTATGRDQDGNPMPGLPSATFTTSDGGVATVAASGVVTAVAAGNASITATMVAGGVTRTATAQVSVTAAPPAGNSVTTPNLTFAPAVLTIDAGEAVTWQFSGSTHNVTFLGTAPAGGDIADQSPGTSASRTFTAGGTYDYECTRHSGMAGSIVVQASGGGTFTSVSLTPGSPQATVGGTLQLTATPRDQVGNAMSGYPAASFTSSNPGTVTVSSTGLVTGVAAGSASVTATITGSGITHSASVTVTVTAPTPGAVTVTTPNLTFAPRSVTIPVGGTVTWQFSGSTHNVTFQGSSPTGGSIGDQNPGSSANRTFGAAGTYDYVCSRHNGMSGTVVVQGGGGTPVFSSVGVTPQTGVVAVGSNLQLTVQALDQYGAPMNGSGSTGYSSGAPAQATVNNSGVVTGVAAGTAVVTVTMTYQGTTKSGTATITVASGNEPTVTTLADEFEPDDLDITAGETVIFQFAGATHNVTFEDLAPPGGSIGDTAPGNAVARTFTVPGDYDYECTIHKGMDGRIRVR
jgi:trimeric autotransporter adhesin